MYYQIKTSIHNQILLSPHAHSKQAYQITTHSLNRSFHTMAEKNREDLLGKVIKLNDIIAYQDGTIASRMIVVSKAGSITLFSFDAGEEISEHTAPYDAVVTVLDGECEVTLNDDQYRLKEGETIIFPANAPHAVRAVTRFKMMLTMIRE